jgi:hypothetical protein
LLVYYFNWAKNVSVKESEFSNNDANNLKHLVQQTALMHFKTNNKDVARAETLEILAGESGARGIDGEKGSMVKPKIHQICKRFSSFQRNVFLKGNSRFAWDTW